MQKELREILDNDYIKLKRLTEEGYVIEIHHRYLSVLAKHLSGCTRWTKQETIDLDDCIGWFCELMIETPFKIRH